MQLNKIISHDYIGKIYLLPATTELSLCNRIGLLAQVRVDDHWTV